MLNVCFRFEFRDCFGVDGVGGAGIAVALEVDFVLSMFWFYGLVFLLWAGLVDFLCLEFSLLWVSASFGLFSGVVRVWVLNVYLLSG